MTRYADRLLADGERIALRARQHWLAPIVAGRVPLAVFFASIVLIILITSLQPGDVRTVLGYVPLVLLLLSLIWLVRVYWEWYSQDYLVTNRRILKVEGIIGKRSADSSLEKINDAVLEQSLFGRMLGYGDLDIMTAAELPVDRYRMLAGAQQFKRTMLDEKYRLEQEVNRAAAPPLRAPPLAAAASAVPPTAPAAGRAITPDELSQALGNLAALRDQGAISAEDYEAKKQDLLGRL